MKKLIFILLLSVVSLSAFAQTNIALNKPVTVSSFEGSSRIGAYAVDGKTNTRWASLLGDPQWIQIDLGSVHPIETVILKWERAYSRHYRIEVSNNAADWNMVYSIGTGKGGIETIKLNTSGRYIRAYLIGRATGWANSLWEFEVYSPVAASSSSTVASSSSTASSASSQIQLKWSMPTERENGEKLTAEEIGGYEIRGFNAKNERKYVHTITNGRTLQHSVAPTAVGGSTRFEIATYDTTGLYSVFKAITPLTAASNPNAPCTCD